MYDRSKSKMSSDREDDANQTRARIVRQIGHSMYGSPGSHDKSTTDRWYCRGCLVLVEAYRNGAFGHGNTTSEKSRAFGSDAVNMPMKWRHQGRSNMFHQLPSIFVLVSPKRHPLLHQKPLELAGAFQGTRNKHTRPTYHFHQPSFPKVMGPFEFPNGFIKT